MQLLKDIVITDINRVIVVHSEKDRCFQMKNRSHYGLSLCVNGQITYTMNGKTYISNQNNAVLLPRGGTYSLYGDKEGFFPLVDFNCENFSCNEIMVLPLQNPQVCLKFFERLKNLSLFKENRLEMFSIFYQMLASVDKEQSPGQRILAPAIAYVAEHIADCRLSNTQLARHLNISEVYLRKLFLAHYNTTPKQYILDIRIQKAKQILTDTPYKIAAIAEECGFAGPYHFCRAFKQRTGQTPTQYATANRIFKI